MRFQPRTESELEAEEAERKANFQPWSVGIYDFLINTAEDTVSKVKTNAKGETIGGNDMIKLSLNIYNQDGQVRQIDDYLLEAFAHKLRHAAYACGLGESYEDANLQSFDFVGKAGRLHLGIQKGKKKDDGSGFFPDRNTIIDYVVPKPTATTEQIHKDLDDSIPFALLIGLCLSAFSLIGIA